MCPLCPVLHGHHFAHEGKQQWSRGRGMISHSDWGKLGERLRDVEGAEMLLLRQLVFIFQVINNKKIDTFLSGNPKLSHICAFYFSTVFFFSFFYIEISEIQNCTAGWRNKLKWLIFL